MIATPAELIVFLREYHRPLLEKEPPQPVILPDIEIPTTLRLLYETFGHHTTESWGPLTSQDYLLSPDKLRIDNRELLFLRENQSCWTCTCALDIEHHPVIRYDHNPAGVRQADTLDEFVISFALQEAVMSSPWLLGIHGAPSVEALKIELSALYRNGHYAYDGPTHNFWITKNRDVICMDGGEGIGLWLASYSEDVLKLRLPDYEYMIISPRDPSEPITFVGRGDGSAKASRSSSFFDRFLHWLHPR